MQICIFSFENFATLLRQRIYVVVYPWETPHLSASLSPDSSTLHIPVGHFPLVFPCAHCRNCQCHLYGHYSGPIGTWRNVTVGRDCCPLPATCCLLPFDSVSWSCRLGGGGAVSGVIITQPSAGWLAACLFVMGHRHIQHTYKQHASNCVCRGR